MEWKFKKNSLDNSQIKLIEQELSVKLPIEFVALIKQNNGARPSKNSYDLKNEKGKFFDSLIDYSFEEKNNVVAVYKRLKTYSVNKMIPFGEDGFGNYICFNYVNEENPNVVFYDHEINEVIEITNSFNEFLDLLY
ncbi:SMI1/KNR4 family protein [Tenacibaculum insulae]|uniref:SMI1/KNR4 family protein n=1 Tax=Tenacibaculum insulae TaxID=2029677 RepID=UPI003AB2F62D